MRYKKPLAATSTLHVVLLEKKPSNLFLPTSAVYKQILTFRDDLRRAVVLEMLLIEFNQLVSKKKIEMLIRNFQMSKCRQKALKIILPDEDCEP